MTQGMPEPEPETRLEVEISPEIEPGEHADFVSIWYTRDTFVLDFTSPRQPPYPDQDADTGNPIWVLPERVVARVRIPASQIWELTVALSRTFTAWEVESGQRPPQDPDLPNPL